MLKPCYSVVSVKL